MKMKGRKFQNYSPIRAKGGEAEHTKVSVEKGFGPRHAANAKEGEGVDLTKINTDVVPAVLTPREAVLNRNAAEMAGRGNIEALNKKGNLLASKGVDLAAGGDEDVREFSGISQGAKKGGGTASEEEIARVLALLAGKVAPENLTEAPLDMKEYQRRSTLPEELENPNRARGDKDVMKSKPKQSEKSVPAYGKLPVPPQTQPAKGGFYPPGHGPFGMAEGDTSVPEGIGRPNPQMAYDPRAQVDFKGPDLSGFLRDMAAEAKKRGISEAQMAGIAKQFAGMGGGAATGGGEVSPDAFWAGSGGYQGGISEIGYPPMLMPNAEYHGDKGSTWTGPYDPQFLVERYAGGTGDVPGLRRGEGDFRGGGGGGFGASTMAWGGDRPSWNPNAFPPDLPPIGGSNTPNLDRPFQGNNGGYTNRSSWQGGQPGMPWSPTAIPTTYDPQGYPFAVPVQGPDQNLQGVGRTHNLRKNV